ncbi:MAG TPA: hypothetical protein VN690_10520 [Terriglobales bacterium]|nr:hypothetical protein [Terriglobales bacterium]
MRKKRRKYKMVEPVAVEAVAPARVLALVTVIQWGFWFAMAGVLVAFGLVLSLYSHWRVDEQVWLRLWPSSIRLMTASGLGPHDLTKLALWTTGENGLLYGVIGAVAGGAHAWFRSWRKRRVKSSGF